MPIAQRMTVYRYHPNIWTGNRKKDNAWLKPCSSASICSIVAPYPPARASPRLQPLRYSRPRNRSASGALGMRRFFASHSIMYKHLHFYLERVGEASEIPARARAGRSVWSKLTAPGQGERGRWVIHGHWEGYGRLVVTGFRTDGYPQGVRWLSSCGTRCGVVRLGGRRACRRGRSPGLKRIARLAGFAR
jgi:hypothetical protein